LIGWFGHRHRPGWTGIRLPESRQGIKGSKSRKVQILPSALCRHSEQDSASFVPARRWLLCCAQTARDKLLAEFYRGLSERGMIIYPGKLTRVDTFRIGTIGRLFETDIAQFLHAIEDVLRDTNCALPLDR
jgi:hypothetical protein